MFGFSNRAIRRLLRDFERSGVYVVEELSAVREPTYRARLRDGSREIIFRMHSKRVTIARRNSDGRVPWNGVQEMTFREYLSSIDRELCESRASG